MKHNPWRCKQCQGNVIVEISNNADVVTQISGIDNEGNLRFGNHLNVANSKPRGYQCLNCGKPIRWSGKQITSRERLTAFLNKLTDKETMVKCDEQAT